MESDALDITPFALPNTPGNEVWFEEPRDIVRVLVEFEDAVPDEIKVSYLAKTWPEVRLDQADNAHPMHFGWTKQDDWFNTKWRDASVSIVRKGGRSAEIVFQGLKTEYPDLTDYDVTYRRTLGVRVEAPQLDAIRAIRVYTASAPAHSVLRVELDAGRETPGNQIRVSGYNSAIESLETVKGVAVEQDAVNLGDERPRQFLVKVHHLIPAYSYCNDGALVTFALDTETFTISLVSLDKEGPIWFEELGVYVARAEDTTSFAEYHGGNGSQTIAQRVRGHGEQSLAGALSGQPRPHPVSYNLGCPRARERFWLEANGDLHLPKRNVEWIKGKDTGRFKSKGSSTYHFGLERWRILARFPDPEPALVYNIHARREALSVEQKTFAVPLEGSILDERWAGDDPMVALVRFRFRNEGGDPVLAALPIAYSPDASRSHNRFNSGAGFDDYQVSQGPRDALVIAGDRLESDWQGRPVLRAAFHTSMAVAQEEKGVLLTQRLAPGESCEVVLKVPFISLETDAELKALDALDFERCYGEVKRYWEAVGRRGAQMSTPEPQLAALHTAHLAHVLITDLEMPDGSGLINTSVGTSTYGNFSNESCMIVNELDQRGLHDEARRRLGIWLRYQGTVPQPGNFTDYEGMFYGAGGFECGAYNQHHGWVLWCLCEHFFLTRDEVWFRSVADAVVAGADWVFRQRRNTMTDLPHSRGWEYGFLPAGSLEDVTDFYYWLSTNALTWRGTEWAARALERIGHPEAPRVRQEADAYRQDLIKGLETMRQYAPLVRLRDGRWVPDYPSRLYRRGRELGWIRETLEGSVYLLISGLYDAESREAGWILDDFQDNRYVRPPYGYLIPDFEMTWFDCAGFSEQPNLLAGLLPYLDRDEPEMYIWMFYNAWAACYREEINAMIEHPMPVLGYSNTAHFKTSDEANAVAWLRRLFVYAKEGQLHLGRAIPRAWLAQSRPFETRGVATPFGEVGVRYEPLTKDGIAKATTFLDLQENPRRTLVRFRHPEQREILSARVNGAAHPIADPVRGDVDITGMNGEVCVEVQY